jgi:MoaA/NifB/PqqE/SkfB family radical SAM enzyme
MNNLTIRKNFPRLPLDGRLDLTYRCNNYCRHCWLWEPSNSTSRANELSFAEIRDIVDQARAMGCQAWAISGGEPMLRSDFVEIFDYITQKTVSYKLNTNGTLITPEIAQLLRRNGNTMVAIYGATPDVHDHVTRTPGSYKAAMQGFAYLKEAGVNFTVQIIPMRDNFHQYDQMVQLALTLSENIRVGAPWLWLSADGSAANNQGIINQRLDPKDVLQINKPNPAGAALNDSHKDESVRIAAGCGALTDGEYLFASCISERRDFHIDPYGGMSFCYYIKDPALRYDLRKGSFQEAWDEFIPSLAKLVRGGQEYRENCASCDLQSDCLWCPVYGYLEHGRYSAKVDYLCQVAQETRRFKENWKLTNLRYYHIGGITIQIASDFPMLEDTFKPKFEAFREDSPGEDTITIKLVSSVPTNSDLRLGQEIFRRPPWAIYQGRDSFVYRVITTDDDHSDPKTLAIVSRDHTQITIYRNHYIFKQGGLPSLTTFTSDQILLAPVLADRQGCFMHASGMIIAGQGLLFVGHSEAGKSTMLKMLRDQGEILCDDRIIVRRWPEGFRIHGTWSHGELPDVSPASAPLRAILFLEQAKTNQLIPIDDMQEKLGKLLSHVVKALITEEWWDKTLTLAGAIAAQVPIYQLKFDKSGQVRDVLKRLYEEI